MAYRNAHIAAAAADHGNSTHPDGLCYSILHTTIGSNPDFSPSYIGVISSFLLILSLMATIFMLNHSYRISYMREREPLQRLLDIRRIETSPKAAAASARHRRSNRRRRRSAQRMAAYTQPASDVSSGDVISTGEPGTGGEQRARLLANDYDVLGEGQGGSISAAPQAPARRLHGGSSDSSLDQHQHVAAGASLGGSVARPGESDGPPPPARPPRRLTPGGVFPGKGLSINSGDVRVDVEKTSNGFGAKGGERTPLLFADYDDDDEEEEEEGYGYDDRDTGGAHADDLRRAQFHEGAPTTDEEGDEDDDWSSDEEDAAEERRLEMSPGAESSSRVGAFLVLPIYYTIIQGVALLFVLQAVAWVLPKDVRAFHYIEYSIFALCTFADLVLVIHISLPRDVRLWVSFTISATITVAMFVYVQLLSTSTDCDWCGIHYPRPGIEYAYLLVGLFMVAVAVASHQQLRIFVVVPPPRRPLFAWALTLSFPYLASALALMLLRSHHAVNFSYCLLNIVLLQYAIMYAPMLYRCIKQDSVICRELDMLDALSHSALAPLLKDTKPGDLPQEIQAILRDASVKVIDYRDIRLRRRVGSGGFGTVWAASWHGLPVALKELFALPHIMHSQNNQEAVQELCREVLVLSKLRHPHCVQFFGLAIGPETSGIVMEYMGGGSVAELIYSDRHIRWHEIKLILEHTCLGMNYLHTIQPPILHRDLKPQNLLIDDHFTIKVSDFGCSTVQKHTQTIVAIGTAAYAAPEVLTQTPFLPASDVYSFGITMWEIVHRLEAFEGMRPLAIAHSVVYENNRPPIAPTCPTALAAIMRDCWQAEADKRPTFRMLLKRMRRLDAHAFFHFELPTAGADGQGATARPGKAAEV